MRVWARGGAALLVAAGAGVVVWSILSVALPAPVMAPRPGPVLESLTPAQLVTMGVRLAPALQPVDLPAWLTGLGVRPRGTVVHGADAEAAVRRNIGGFQGVQERALAYATVSVRGGRPHGPVVVHRLVWALVGARTSGANVGGLVEVLWLVDARTGSQLTEVAVLAPLPGVGSAP